MQGPAERLNLIGEALEGLLLAHRNVEPGLAKPVLKSVPEPEEPRQEPREPAPPSTAGGGEHPGPVPPP